MKIARESSKTTNDGYLDGQVLVTMPTIQDERFNRSVIYLCAHSSEGAMGSPTDLKSKYVDTVSNSSSLLLIKVRNM